MATFNSFQVFSTGLTDLYGVAEDTRNYFLGRGYEVNLENTPTGYFLSLSKGGIFKSILGMKTALNVELRPSAEGIAAEARVGIWGLQAIPTLIMLFVTWPVLLTQITGLVQQAKLDDEVMAVVGESIQNRENGTSTDSDTQFCVCCGKKIPAGTAYCSYCGGAQE